MHQFFLICATLGGTILLLRLLIAVIGVGSDSFHGDIDATAPDHAGLDGHDHQSSIGRIFTFQAIVSFLAFFGIGGLSVLEAKGSPPLAVLTGTITGIVAVTLLGYALRSLRHLNADGTVRLERSTGTAGMVYLRVPGSESGEGKIFLPIQGRSVEVYARTPGPELRPGEAVVVCRAIDDHTVEVVAAHAYVEKPPALVD